MFMSKKELAEEKMYRARRVKDCRLYSAMEVYELKLSSDNFVDPERQWHLTYVAPYERRGRTDSKTPGSEKPKVKVRAYFKKKLSLNDYHELHGVNDELKTTEHIIHHEESEWHKGWQARVSHFCEIEKRFYPDDVVTKEGYKIADAYYEEANTVIEFQASFGDNAFSKTSFYSHEKIRLIWLFYLPTLTVFENEGLYKIGEDNLYHFFRVEDKMPGFFEDSIVFIQDSEGKIYHVDHLGRVATSSELEGTVRFFDKGLKFEDSETFALWLQNDWPKSELFRNGKSDIELRSATDILSEFEGKPDSFFYMQNCTKNDINGKSLIYCFRKDNGVIRGDTDCYYSYRCFDKNGIFFVVNKQWRRTIQSKTSKVWLLLATNRKKYHDEVKIKD